MIDPSTVALATDLYQLTMGAGYQANGMRERATFSLFVRTMPPSRRFLVVAGLEDALNRIRTLRFDREAIDYIRSSGHIHEDFLDALPDLRFRGDVWAMPEGRVFFANEPILEVEATILEAQLVETAVINAMHYPVLVATTAARCVAAAPEATMIEFGLRRTPSIDAGLAASRASYLAGFASTSNVLAGQRYGIPIAGTMAHSFVEAFPSELEAFRAFASTYPGPPTLLIDTYDAIIGARHAVRLARELADHGRRLLAIRIDSGDLGQLSRAVRDILDEAGEHEVRIVASGGLDETQIAELTRSGAPIDAYGVGTRLVTSSDAPSADMAYKLVQYAGTPRLKLSDGKQTLIGPKQVWRGRDANGRFAGDVIAARAEPAPGPDWEPLLERVMQDGELLSRATLEEGRARHRAEMASLPPALLDATGHAPYAVALSARLDEQQRGAVEAARRAEGLIARGS